MIEDETFSEKVLEFNKQLSGCSIDMPEGFNVINPFKGNQKDQVHELTVAFYTQYYNDKIPRKMILGSSPARRGTAVTGVPFEDVCHLHELAGLNIEGYSINRSSSDFLQDVIINYGGREKFYLDFYMGFVCPLGITKTNSRGNEVNYNYYESKKIENFLYPLIVKSIKSQLNFGIDRTICYCIGSGENFKFLKKVNECYSFFEKIIPLEHPRYIMQYNSSRKDYFMEKYLRAFSKRNGDK
ncbi:uracil-DNA glycosylase family protein [Enterococcus faecalis]|uniref:uracil-DNA glycosylase family protein n=1 Tax=Enterococcus faecalis TaxID=1351 RepID=UPI0019DE9211|nr:uracil-DNA glycosylase family protein [Enterococcus faecalis]EGO8510061.1 DUF4918 family protein [Enterococcus faecalis]EGO8997143.1 DUF4918 family protein [Enterococcus faecalis]EGQ7428084.1 DUF4918 family protein [Enterococcus faecalis]